jgi:hypothetical protein
VIETLVDSRIGGIGSLKPALDTLAPSFTQFALKRGGISPNGFTASEKLDDTKAAASQLVLFPITFVDRPRHGGAYGELHNAVHQLLVPYALGKKVRFSDTGGIERFIHV